MHTPLLDYHSRDTHGGVSSHLDGSQATALIAFFAQLRGTIYDQFASADLSGRVAHCPRSVAPTSGRIVAFAKSAIIPWRRDWKKKGCTLTKDSAE